MSALCLKLWRPAHPRWFLLLDETIEAGIDWRTGNVHWTGCPSSQSDRQGVRQTRPTFHLVIHNHQYSVFWMSEAPEMICFTWNFFNFTAWISFIWTELWYLCINSVRMDEMAYESFCPSIEGDSCVQCTFLIWDIH